MRPATDEVDVWVVSLDEQQERRPELEGLLSADESERACTYRMPAAAERFVLARGLLREILGRYTGVAPEDLRFSYPCLCGRDDCAPSRRKPQLDHDPQLRFNLSHSDGLALVAVANGREVGIDVERVDPSARVASTAEQLFAAPEVAELRGLPERQRIEAFYALWTRKEARGKARGTGLTGSAEDFGRWSYQVLPVPDGYFATLAVEANHCLVRTATWPPSSHKERGAEPAA